MSRIVLASAVMVVVSLPAYAVFEPKPADACIPAGNSATFKVSTQKLLKYLLLTENTTDLDLNTNGADLVHSDRVQAILHPEQFCNSSPCGEKVLLRLETAQITLENYLMRAAAAITGDEGIRITSRTNGKRASLEQFLERPSEINAVCHVSPKPPKQEPTKFQKLVDKTVNRISIRKQISDLPYLRDDPKFKGVSRASFSASKDYEAQTTSISVDAVLGYQIGPIPISDNTFLHLVPFGSYKRNSLAGIDPKKDKNIENIGTGVVSQFTFSAFEIGHDLQVYPRYLQSTKTDARLFSGNLVYTPALGYFGIGQVWYPFGPSVGFLLNPQFKLIYGSVLNDGGNPELVATQEYERYGTHVGFTIFPEDVPGLGFTTSYDYFKIVRGTRSMVQRLELSANYTFPKQEYWSLQAKYVDGRDLDTLERERQWMLGIGLKY